MTKEELFSIRIKQPSPEIYRKSKERWDHLAKPIDGLGVLEKIVSRIAAASGRVCPDTDKKALIIMCADNGVTQEGISQTGHDVTLSVASLMGDKKSSVGSMAGNYPVDFFVYDVGIDSQNTPQGVTDAKIRRGTRNFLKEPAMTLKECLAAIQTGIGAAGKCRDEGYGIIATGEMGIGNTTTSTALLCAVKGLDPKEYTGRGAGLSDEGMRNKIRVIEEGLRLHIRPNDHDGITSKEEALEALTRLGGLDIAGLVGVFIGSAKVGIPVIIDGLISAVAALLADRIVPGCRDYMIASHLGREKGMKAILDDLGLDGIINADLALGEGTGAVLMFPMLDMAMSLYLSGTFFDETQIEQYERFDG